MKHTIIIENIPLHIRTNGLEINDYLMRKLCQFVSNLKKISNDILHVDLRMDELEREGKSSRNAAVIVGFVDISLSASDSGKQWKFILKQVQKRLEHQILRRKMLLTRTSGGSTSKILAGMAAG